ncbi:MAG: NUDIX domain-containing protein [Myxococcota bacterium]
MKYKNPKPTVDIIIEIKKNNTTYIVLIERKNAPFGMALPGGFVDEGEPLWEAAVREAKEETSLEVEPYFQFHTYSAPDRDPRQHTISTVFLAKADGIPVAGDDAKKAHLVNPRTVANLVFDHKKILQDYLDFVDNKKLPPWNN